MTFYGEMADMVQELLAPDAAGGLGQGPITVVRLTPGTVDPDQPWVPVTPGRMTEVVNQIGEVKAEYSQGGTIITTDLAYMITPVASFAPRPGDIVERDGQPVGTVVHAETFPPHGVAVYGLLYVNR